MIGSSSGKLDGEHTPEQISLHVVLALNCAAEGDPRPVNAAARPG
jgi:hypothetical protein